MLDTQDTPPGPGLTRREFVKSTLVVSGLAAGFALAVQPVSAQTIHTGVDGLTEGEVQIPTADGHIPAYRAMPNNGRALPVVLVVQEIFGVHEHIKDVCRRFAKQGYLAIAPELFARQGDVSKMQDISEIVSKVVPKVPDTQVMSDLDAALAFAAKTAGGDTTRLGITGFCWGGRIVWLYAAHNPRVKAAVAWYGRLVGATDPLHPANPIDIASAVKVPVLGLYGGQDQGITQESIAQMREKLKAAGSPSELVVYPDAGHGFHADYRPSYNAKDSADGDKRLLAWFKKYGAA